MRRREFIRLAGCAAAWPVFAHGQQAMPVIGFLHSASAATFAEHIPAFHKGLNEAGYVDGQNATVDYRWAEGRNETLPALAADLVQRRVAVIVTPISTPAALAAKAATSTIPIVFVIGADPVQSGLVASFNRPGGNLTGINFRSIELTSKRVEFLSELVPQATTIAFLSGTASQLSFEEQKSNMLAAARALGRQVIVLECRSWGDFEAAFATMVERGAGAFVVSVFPVFFELRNRDRILE